ncbi:MAG: acyltransferase family protein [Gemmataceae bacterium]
MVQPPSTTSKSKLRVGWVDASKGICIFAVVTLYAANHTRETFSDAGWMQYWVDFAKPFRMPDFFLISGLFLRRVLDRSWIQYLDKKVVHYAYFFFLWTLINFAILRLLGELQNDGTSVTRQLFWVLTWYPFHMLWFIQMLPAYFVFAKVTHFIPKWVMLAIACILQTVWALELGPLPTSRKVIDLFWVYYIYFYLGSIGYSYFFLFAQWVREHKALAVIGLVMWGIVNTSLVHIRIADLSMFVAFSELLGEKGVVTLADLPGVNILLGLVGATGIITLAALIDDLDMFQWVRYLGRHSIVVYLAFYWPMVFGANLLESLRLLEGLYGIFAVLLTLTGLAGSVGLYWMTEVLGYGRWLFHRPSWLSIYRSQ